MMAACAAFIHGRGNSRGYHDFGISLLLALNLAVEGVIGVAIEAKIPVEAVLGGHNPGDEGFHHTVGNVLSSITVGVLPEGVLQYRQLFGVVHHFSGLAFGGESFDFLFQTVDLCLHFIALAAEQLPAQVALRPHFNVGIQLLVEPAQLCPLGFQQGFVVLCFFGVANVGLQNGIGQSQHLILLGQVFAEDQVRHHL